MEQIVLPSVHQDGASQEIIHRAIIERMKGEGAPVLGTRPWARQLGNALICVDSAPKDGLRGSDKDRVLDAVRNSLAFRHTVVVFVRHDAISPDGFTRLGRTVFFLEGRPMLFQWVVVRGAGTEALAAGSLGTYVVFEGEDVSMKGDIEAVKPAPLGLPEPQRARSGSTQRLPRVLPPATAKQHGPPPLPPHMAPPSSGMRSATPIATPAVRRDVEAAAAQGKQRVLKLKLKPRHERGTHRRRERRQASYELPGHKGGKGGADHVGSEEDGPSEEITTGSIYFDGAEPPAVADDEAVTPKMAPRPPRPSQKR